MRVRNNIGPGTYPRGTPDVTSASSELASSMTTRRVGPPRNDLIQHRVDPFVKQRLQFSCYPWLLFRWFILATWHKLVNQALVEFLKAVPHMLYVAIRDNIFSNSLDMAAQSALWYCRRVLGVHFGIAALVFMSMKTILWSAAPSGGMHALLLTKDGVLVKNTSKMLFFLVVHVTTWVSKWSFVHPISCSNCAGLMLALVFLMLAQSISGRLKSPPILKSPCNSTSPLAS